jgi:hypothetical protein
MKIKFADGNYELSQTCGVTGKRFSITLNRQLSRYIRWTQGGLFIGHQLPELITSQLESLASGISPEGMKWIWPE